MKKYPALRFIIGAANILAYGTAGLIVLGGLVASLDGGGVVFLSSIVIGLLVWVGIKSYAELIQVWINIESNTSQLRQQTKEIL